MTVTMLVQGLGEKTCESCGRLATLEVEDGDETFHVCAGCTPVS
jgi:hypothetical protein